MREVDIIRAWKDTDYRESLSEEERSHLPLNPAGELEIELNDDDLEAVNNKIYGAGTPSIVLSIIVVSAAACPTGNDGVCSLAFCEKTAYGCPESSLPNSGCPMVTYGTTKPCPMPIPAKK